MTHPATVRITTPTISIVISSGVCKSARLTMSVVAPVGGWEERRSSRIAPVSCQRERPGPHTRERHAFCEDAWMVEQPEDGEREDPGQDRHEVTDQGVTGARRCGQRLLEKEERRRRPQARYEQGLLEGVRRQPAHYQREQAGHKRVEDVSIRAEAIYELPVDAVVAFGHY
jgi:hypothetical protein